MQSNNKQFGYEQEDNKLLCFAGLLDIATRGKVIIKLVIKHKIECKEANFKTKTRGLKQQFIQNEDVILTHFECEKKKLCKTALVLKSYVSKDQRYSLHSMLDISLDTHQYGKNFFLNISINIKMYSYWFSLSFLKIFSLLTK